MSDVASALAWCSIGIVDGDRKLRMEAMVQQDPCTERCDVGTSLFVLTLVVDCKTSTHAWNPRVAMSTCCLMSRLVDREE